MIRHNQLLKKIKNKIIDFDLTDSLLEINFELFCNFYENGQLEIVDWWCDKDHKIVKKEMDYLYFWWKTLRIKQKNKFEEIQEKILNGMHVMFSINNTIDIKYTFPYTQNRFNKLIKIENYLENSCDRHLQRLVKIRLWLWT